VNALAVTGHVRVALLLLGTWLAGNVVAQTATAPAPAPAPATAAGSGAAAATDLLWVGRFREGIAGWREVQLNARTARNRFETRRWDGVEALEVHSQKSMSLLARPVTVDLARTPVLCWRWRVDAPLVGADMATREGDDYAARVYVSLAIPADAQSFALRAQLRVARTIWGPEVPDAALNYVWDNRQPIGTVRPNAYTARAQMLVLRTGAADAGRWVWERRDVARDAAAAFGPEAAPVQVAVTADTDNTGESAHAGFADLHFVARERRCES
jgi:Protein of unknown function (DUF3047)